MNGCIFCRIAKEEIKSKIVYKGPDLVAFEDIKPKAPVHIIIIPKKHIERISDINENDTGLIARLFFTARNIARERDIESSGYRLVINCNRNAGQEVFHLHLHLLGGRSFTWPPG